MSSLILLVIIAAWAVVLVPMLLSRHESTNETRSVDRFASAMRVLARRSAAANRDQYVVVLRRPESSPSVVVNGTTPFTSYVGPAASRVVASEPAQAADPAPVPAAALEGRALSVARRRVVARRRRVVLSLTVMAVALVLLAPLVSSTLWIPQVLCDVLLGTYLLHLRREAARMATRRARSAARARRAAEQSTAAEAASAARAALPTPANAVIIEKQEDGSWHPVPVPLPTYVTAPMAPSRPSAPARAAGERRDSEGLSTEEDLDRRIDNMERRLAVND